MHQTAQQNVNRAVAYARVSSKEQSEEGFSIPAQQRLLRDYAATHGITITEEFVDVETARRAGREGFGKMLDYLKKHSGCRTLLTEKVDRLYRNIADWVKIDDCSVNVHFVKENAIIGPDSRSNDQLIHGFKVLMARNYSQNLAEEARKGMLEKARSGIYPSNAPVGYKNADGPNGKRIIIPDPATAPIVARLFELFATGRHSVKSLAQHAQQAGITLFGRPLGASELHLILRRRLYMGEFTWNKTIYQGTHEPLITRETWERAHAYLEHRSYTKGHIKKAFTFSGFVRCGHCGCLLVGEAKKEGRYTYYHCTGNRGQKCDEPYTREEAMTEQFTSALRSLVIPKDVITWLQTEVVKSDQHHHTARQATIKRHEEDLVRIEARIEKMYLDKLDEKITGDLYERKATEWRADQERLRRTINDLRLTAPEPLDQAVHLLDLTSNACDTFNNQPAAEQRRSSPPSSTPQPGKKERSPSPCSNPSKHYGTRTRQVLKESKGTEPQEGI
jgi:site-specific DNA recombinase